MTPRFSSLLIAAIAVGALASSDAGAQSIFGRNLIANPGAEAGDVSEPQYSHSVPFIPDWIRAGKTDVIPYGRFMDLSHLAPANHLNNYFVGGWSNSASSLSQQIDISAGAAAIDGGGVTFDASAYLGDDLNKPDTAAMTVTFQDGAGRRRRAGLRRPAAGRDVRLGRLPRPRTGAHADRASTVIRRLRRGPGGIPRAHGCEKQECRFLPSFRLCPEEGRASLTTWAWNSSCWRLSSAVASRS